MIRDFGRYEWAGVAARTTIEEGKAATEVGAVRRIDDRQKVIRQALLAHSDIRRSYSYAFCGAPPIPVQDYEATIRVTPVVENDRAFVEWWATFDCRLSERDQVADNLRTSFA